MNTYKVYVDGLFMGEWEDTDPFNALVVIMSHAVRKGMEITNSMVFTAELDETTVARFYAGGGDEDEHDRMLREVRTVLQARDAVKGIRVPASGVGRLYPDPPSTQEDLDAMLKMDLSKGPHPRGLTTEVIGLPLDPDDCDGETTGVCSGCLNCQCGKDDGDV